MKIDRIKLRKAIKARGLKVGWVALQADITQNYLSMILMGIRNPSQEKLSALAKILQVRQRDLLK